MYAPSDDSLLLADAVRGYSGKSALEIGVGSCIVADALAENFALVAGSDIDIEAIRFCQQRGSAAILVCCDAASALRGPFDLIVSNPPYLPDDNFGNAKDETVHGGKYGIETTLHFIESALPLLSMSGRILVVASSHSRVDMLLEKTSQMGLAAKTINEKRVFYEELSVIELRRQG